MFDQITLPNGLRVVGEKLSHVRSCNVGIWVKVGSMNEAPEENGMSHFIELTPGKDGMLHISKMADHRVEKVEDVMNIGDEIEVKVNEIDSQGRVNLIRNDITYPAHDAAPRANNGGERRRPPRRDGRPAGGSDRT